MNTNEITIVPVKSAAIAKTGNERLDKLSAEITKQMDKASSLYTEVKAKTEAYARACAPLFGEIKRDKLYEKGGFKSLEEYASQFGIQKSTAYMWARVGEKFFLEDNEYTRRIRDTLTIANMAELANADRVAAAKAIESGEIDKDTAQQTVREFAAAHKLPGKSGKTNVVPTFDLYAMSPAYDNGKKLIAESVLKEELPATAENFSALPNYVSAKLDGDKASSTMHFLMFSESGVCAMFEYRPHVKKHDSKDDKRAWAAKDIKTMLKGMSHKERLAFLESLADAPDDGDDESAE